MLAQTSSQTLISNVKKIFKLNIYVVSHIESGHEYEYQLDHTIMIKQSWDVGQFIELGAYEQQHFVIIYLSIYAMAKPT